MDKTAMFRLGYGLYIVTATDKEKDNGCIINTVMQITDTPLQIIAGINKENYTHAMIVKTKQFNLSVLSEETPFSVFQHFGFQSGKTVNKFSKQPGIRGSNGTILVSSYSNAILECSVKEIIDTGTHSLFLAEVTEAKVLNNQPSMTYAYYHSHVKPQPSPKKQGWICNICGYVYEGETLPENFICPICKHGASDFKKIE